MLDKLGGVYAPRPSTGPHKLRESLPLVIFLRNRLKYALTNCEVTKIVMQRLIKVDGKIRTDSNYPAGFMGECFCLLDIVIYFLHLCYKTFDGNWPYRSYGTYNTKSIIVKKWPIIKQVLHFGHRLSCIFFLYYPGSAQKYICSSYIDASIDKYILTLIELF